MAFKMKGMPGIAGVKAEKDRIKALVPEGTKANQPKSEGPKYLTDAENNEKIATKRAEMVEGGATATELKNYDAYHKKNNKRLAGIN